MAPLVAPLPRLMRTGAIQGSLTARMALEWNLACPDREEEVRLARERRAFAIGGSGGSPPAGRLASSRALSALGVRRGRPWGRPGGARGEHRGERSRVTLGVRHGVDGNE